VRGGNQLLKGFKMKKYLFITVVLSFLACVAQAQDPNDEPGLTAWALGGSGVQELRIGYQGLLPTIELAAAVRHLDVMGDGQLEQWPIRGYAIAHALDAEMLASILGNEIELPKGNLYAGLFGEYTFDRDNEWACGYVVGGLVDFPRGWQTVLEYDATVFNSTSNEYEFMLGLRKRF